MSTKILGMVHQGLLAAQGILTQCMLGNCLFVCFVALRPKSTAMVIAGRSVHLTTLFSWASFRPQTCKCKKGTDWLKRWVEAQHNIFKL